MKKLFVFMALVMGVAFGVNAQTYVTDTVAHVDSIYANLNDTMPAGVITFENGLPCHSTVLQFTASGITDNYILGVDITGKMTGGTDTVIAEYTYYVSGYDTCTMYDTMWTEDIDHIDTIAGGHPGTVIYDTVYAYDTILTYIDSLPILTPYFHNDTNVFAINDFDTIYSISFVGLLDHMTDEYQSDYEFLLTDVYVFNDREVLGIDKVEASKITVYPNPSKDAFYIDGDFNTLYVMNAMGQCIETTRYHIVNMSDKPSGVYYFKFDNGTAVKVIKF